MHSPFILSYTATEVLLIVFSVAIPLLLSLNLGSEHEGQALKIPFMLFLVPVTDIFWAMVEDHITTPHPLLNASVNAVLLSAVAAGCYFWYKFTEYRLHSKFFSNRRFYMLMNIPLAAAVVLNLLSIFTGWVFYIDAHGSYTLGPLFVVQGAVCYLYLMIPTVRSLRMAIKSRSSFQRREYLAYAVYMVPPLLAGLLEDYIPTVPVLCLSMFMIIHMLFLMIQDMQIYNDALTGLNNRRRLSQFLEERIPSTSAENPLSVFMVDVNRFKSINDTYGHVEGDAALKTVAQALKMTAVDFYAFAARYGGDKFCLVVIGSSHRPEEVADRLRKHLMEIQKGQEPSKGYTVTVSIGYVVRHTPDYSSDDLISRADFYQYQDKRNCHRANEK